jgi:hypothetical protein
MQRDHGKRRKEIPGKEEEESGVETATVLRRRCCFPTNHFPEEEE